MFLKQFLNNVCSVSEHLILLKEATVIRECCFSKDVYFICQSNVHMDNRTLCFNWVPHDVHQNMIHRTRPLPFDWFGSDVHISSFGS